MVSKLSDKGYMSQNMLVLQSQTIDWLRFPLIIAVAFIHNSYLPDNFDVSHIDWYSLYGSYWFIYVDIFFSHVLSHIAVPAFYLISGFLFFLKTSELNKQIYKNKIKKRFYTLFIPYILWNIVPVIIQFTINAIKYLFKAGDWNLFVHSCILYLSDHGWLNIFWSCSVWAQNRLSWIGTHMTMTGPLNLPLWYLRDLILITLFTPLIYWCIKKIKIFFLIILTLFYISGIWPQIPALTSTTVLFFSAGAYLAIYRYNIIATFRKIEFLSYFIAIILLASDTYYDGYNTPVGFNLYHLYVIFGVIAIFNFASRLLEKKYVRVNKNLTNSVFFIYACHTLWLIGLYDRVVHKMLFNVNYIEPIVYITTPFVKVIICFFLYMMLEKYTPKLIKPFTGNR